MIPPVDDVSPARNDGNGMLDPRRVDDASARRPYAGIAAIPGLRPHDLIITNYPSLDDRYQTDGLFEFGRWVNGGHWSTCEARAILACYRVGAFDGIWSTTPMRCRWPGSAGGGARGDGPRPAESLRISSTLRS